MTVSRNWLLGDPSEIYWSSEAERKSELTIHKEVEKDENLWRVNMFTRMDDEAWRRKLQELWPLTNMVKVVVAEFYIIIIKIIEYLLIQTISMICIIPKIFLIW